MKPSKELKIGIFVTIVLILSFFIINFLREKDIFNRQMELSATFPDVCGLTESAPVYIKGYKAGAVSDIAYDNVSGMFTVTCSFDKGFALPSDSKMVIYSVDIMGGKGVDIVPGEASGLLSDGDLIYGDVRPDMLSSLSDALIPLMGKISAAADSLGHAAGNVSGILDESARKKIESLLESLQATALNAERISGALGERADELGAFAGDLATLSSGLMSVVEKADTAMAKVNGVVSDLDDADIKSMAESLERLLELMQSPDGTVGRLLHDPKVYDSLESLLLEADSLVKKISENPRKYVRISLF